MARPLATDSLSLTGAGVALVTDRAGSIHADAIEGLLIGDQRVISGWSLGVTDAVLRHVGRERTGASSDRLLATLTEASSIDPTAVVERRRRVDGHGFVEELSVTAYSRPCRCTLTLTAHRDDATVFTIGGHDLDRAVSVRHDGPGFATLAPVDGGPDVATIRADGWDAAPDGFMLDLDLEAGERWQGSVSVRGSTDRAREAASEPSRADLATSPPELGRTLSDARLDVRALTMPVGGRDVIAAGSPFFLALFGRDSMIAGMQFVLDSVRPLLDVLHELARHQAVAVDEFTGAQPGRILHELRLGRVGVFGLPPGEPYYGAVDTSALFVVALGEAMRWGAPLGEVAALLPAARGALRWCAEFGDIDGDGFVESVPHRTGLINLGWKDSGDSILDGHGTTIVGSVALAEVQAYWYRALRTIADIERAVDEGDGAESDAEADRLATRFLDRFVYPTDDGPFVGLALDPDKELLRVRTSNAGHALWAGVLPADVAASVATQLGGPALFSGWGVRTVAATAPGYNPFGYHRGAVWPHDTAIALHGASRYGCDSVVRRLSEGLVALAVANGGQLPELLSGIGRGDVTLPVPYAAACRPQAWSAGAPLMVARSLLGLEPDVPNGVVRLRPCLDDGSEVTVRDLRLGDHLMSFTVRGHEVVDLHASGLDVVVGDEAVFARSGWGARDLA